MSNTSRHNLARIPLRWMIRQCFLTNTGIRFHAELLKEVGLDPRTLWPHAKPGVEFGPGLAHAPRIPPLMPSPRISLDPPTPPERTREDVERRVLRTMFPGNPAFAAQVVVPLGFALGADDEDGKINPLAGMGLTDEQYTLILQNLVNGESFTGVGALEAGAAASGGESSKRALDDDGTGREAKRSRFELIE